MTIRIHPSAEVAEGARIGAGTSIWHHAQVREGAVIGQSCIIGKGVYIDSGVIVGSNVKIQNYACLYHGLTVEDGVFIGPHVCFTNDLIPRAVNSEGMLKQADDWEVLPTLVGMGAAIGANSTILCGVSVGTWAMVGAGSVVTRSIPDHGLVIGNPARVRGFVCRCGRKLPPAGESLQRDEDIRLTCHICSSTVTIPHADYLLIQP